MAAIPSNAGGPGVFSPDGCAVELYALLPADGEPELIHRAVPPRASILDLGCGTGRVASPLVGLGHEVVGVDESAEMLAHVAGARTVQARIQDLRLPETFDVVLLASHLLNTPDVASRHRLVRTCREHVAEHGQVLVQWHPPEWFDGLKVGGVREAALGPVTTRLDVHAFRGNLLDAEVIYRVDDRQWVQRFTARRLTEQQLAEELGSAGLEFRRWLDPGHHWLGATAGGRAGAPGLSSAARSASPDFAVATTGRGVC